MDDKVKHIIKEVHANNGKVPAHIVDQMFEVHNQLFPKSMEFNKGCGTCRKRTFSRIQTYFNQNLNNLDNTSFG